jgi:hypothetical protein
MIGPPKHLLTRARGLSPADRRLLGGAVILHGAFLLGLRLLAFPTVLRVQKVLGRPIRRIRKPHRSSPARVAWAVDATTRLLPAATCLSRALTAYTMLARRGTASVLHIGVGTGMANELRAHAWVEVREEVVVGGSDSPERFRRLARWAT